MGANEELNFNFYFIFINLKENSHMWLTVILLDSRGICVRKTSLAQRYAEASCVSKANCV